MRRLVDENATFFDAIQILMSAEQKLGIDVKDETVENIRPWSELSLRDLATAVERSDSTITHAAANEAVNLAVRAEFSDAPDTLDFNLPLHQALSPHRYE
ncbi:MAG: hypothetical protein IAE77_22385 [Prosthecobacter sp.]|jgi:hypothetical protein|nr:hypothetical protein [Prosthecobacter sp.]